LAAFTITSEERPMRSSTQQLYTFLEDFKNFGSILPPDKVQDFKYSENECSFVIKGITPMTVKMQEKVPGKYILYSSEGMGKFSFSLKVVFNESAGEKGSCLVELNGDLNPFIKAMAEKPLAALVNTMAQRLSELEPE
jgi:hypothetical protein